jgi:hypothetical protein
MCKHGGGSSPLGRIKISANHGVLIACDPFVIAYKSSLTQVVAQPNNLPNASPVRSTAKVEANRTSKQGRQTTWHSPRRYDCFAT